MWIQRINAAARLNGMNYSTFMNGCTRASIGLDRKVLSEIAIHDPEAFAVIAKVAKAAATNSQGEKSRLILASDIKSFKTALEENSLRAVFFAPFPVTTTAMTYLAVFGLERNPVR